MKETQARPETLLPAELWCTVKDDGSNNGEYEVIIPLIYLIQAMKQPAQFYKFKFKGLRYADKRETVHTGKHRRTKKQVS